MDVIEFAGLLETAKRFDEGIEEEHAILIEMQFAILGDVAFATVVVEAFQ